MQQPGHGGYGGGAPVQPGAMVPYGLNGGFNPVCFIPFTMENSVVRFCVSAPAARAV